MKLYVVTLDVTGYEKRPHIYGIYDSLKKAKVRAEEMEYEFHQYVSVTEHELNKDTFSVIL